VKRCIQIQQTKKADSIEAALRFKKCLENYFSVFSALAALGFFSPLSDFSALAGAAFSVFSPLSVEVRC